MADGSTRRILLLGATGTIGRAVAQALTTRGHEVVCPIRPRSGAGGTWSPDQAASRLRGAQLRVAMASDPRSLASDGFRGEPFDVLISCLASRTGAPKDAWAIDYEANLSALTLARQAGVTQAIYLSAICVQKPKLAFQRAKLAFEKALIGSGLAYSIVRPTAFFKSLSGQVERVRRGKPYLLFGDGELTACKPISDDDLAAFIADCVTEERLRDRILPIGGPGEAITPLAQAERLFARLGLPPRYRRISPNVLKTIANAMSALGRFSSRLEEKAALARIGHYYATESMLVWDEAAGRYDAAKTPATGTQTLFDYYDRLITGEASAERGDHAVF